MLLKTSQVQLAGIAQHIPQLKEHSNGLIILCTHVSGVDHFGVPKLALPLCSRVSSVVLQAV